MARTIFLGQSTPQYAHYSEKSRYCETMLGPTSPNRRQNAMTGGHTFMSDRIHRGQNHRHCMLSGNIDIAEIHAVALPTAVEDSPNTIHKDRALVLKCYFVAPYACMRGLAWHWFLLCSGTVRPENCLQVVYTLRTGVSMVSQYLDFPL
jgi:hypothetical protein